MQKWGPLEANFPVTLFARDWRIERKLSNISTRMLESHTDKWGEHYYCNRLLQFAKLNFSSSLNKHNAEPLLRTDHIRCASCVLHIASSAKLLKFHRPPSTGYSYRTANNLSLLITSRLIGQPRTRSKWLEKRVAFRPFLYSGCSRF